MELAMFPLETAFLPNQELLYNVFNPVSGQVSG